MSCCSEIATEGYRCNLPIDMCLRTFFFYQTAVKWRACHLCHYNIYIYDVVEANGNKQHAPPDLMQVSTFISHHIIITYIHSTSEGVLHYFTLRFCILQSSSLWLLHRTYLDFEVNNTGTYILRCVHSSSSTSIILQLLGCM